MHLKGKKVGKTWCCEEPSEVLLIFHMFSHMFIAGSVDIRDGLSVLFIYKGHVSYSWVEMDEGLWSIYEKWLT